MAKYTTDLQQRRHDISFAVHHTVSNVKGCVWNSERGSCTVEKTHSSGDKSTMDVPSYDSINQNIVGVHTPKACDSQRVCPDLPSALEKMSAVLYSKQQMFVYYIENLRESSGQLFESERKRQCRLLHKCSGRAANHHSSLQHYRRFVNDVQRLMRCSSIPDKSRSQKHALLQATSTYYCH